MKKATITYGITACNEEQELDRLLSQLLTYADQEDEVIVQVDSESVTQEVLEVIKNYKSEFKEVSFSFVSFPLNRDFANFKNNLILNSKRDYIFFIDADEYLSVPLLKYIKTILTENYLIECIHVPRVNTVEGLTEDHIAKWRWRIGKLKSMIQEKELDTESDEYALLNAHNLIISEKAIL